MRNTVKSLCQRIDAAFPVTPIPHWEPCAMGDSEAQPCEDAFAGNPWISFPPEVIEVRWFGCTHWLAEGTELYYLPAFLKASVVFPDGLVGISLVGLLSRDYADCPEIMWHLGQMTEEERATHSRYFPGPLFLKMFEQMTEEQRSITVDVLKRVMRCYVMSLGKDKDEASLYRQIVRILDALQEKGYLI